MHNSCLIMHARHTNLQIQMHIIVTKARVKFQTSCLMIDFWNEKVQYAFPMPNGAYNRSHIK